MVCIQAVGGPTAILELGGLRLLTDPTFDPPGDYPRPDGPTQLKAMALYFAYVVGQPVERRIIEHHNLDSLDDLEKKLGGSEAMCETLLKMIDRARAARLKPAITP